MDEIRDITEKWGEALASATVDQITKLYDEEAVLWGTLSPVIRNTPALIAEYFERFAGLSDISVDFEKQYIRLFGSMAVNTGYYTFTWTDEDKNIAVPARYTFVYRKTGDGWKIVDQHSSVIPEQPFKPEKYMRQ
jgi:uncharacterized protein (TIGR02246 family)